MKRIVLTVDSSNELSELTEEEFNYVVDYLIDTIRKHIQSDDELQGLTFVRSTIVEVD